MNANSKWLAIQCVIKEHRSHGRPVKPKMIGCTVEENYALTSLFIYDAAEMGHPRLLIIFPDTELKDIS